MRRLNRERLGLKSRYPKVGIFEQYIEPASEYYGPTKRYGSYPKYWNEVVDPDRFKTNVTGILLCTYISNEHILN